MPPLGRGEAGRLALASLWPVLILVVLVVVSYLPAMLWGGFVWDDVILAKSKAVPEWSGLWRIWLQPTEAVGGEGHYWPLVYTTFWLEHKLWGFAPAGYHVVNVALHLANTVLLWHLLGRLAVPGSVADRGRVRRPSAARGVGRLGDRAQGRPVRPVLPRRLAGVDAFRGGAEPAALCAGVGAVHRGSVEQIHRGHPAGRPAGVALVEAGPHRGTRSAAARPVLRGRAGHHRR